MSGEKEESFKKVKKTLLVNSGTGVDDLCFPCKIVGCKGSHSCMFDSNVFHASGVPALACSTRACHASHLISVCARAQGEHVRLLQA